MADIKEWTLMFYFASDNPLAISIVSQLKALKAAGYHHKVNVIAQFDPFTPGTPTHIFDVNLVNKLTHPGESNIGFAGTDSFVRTLVEDKLWRDESTSKGDRLIRDVIKDVFNEEFGPKHQYEAPMAPELNGAAARYGARRNELDPYICLERFINFCAEKYPANHYMLFMIGHGVVVGNDVFMYDEHAEHKSITLAEMGDILREFKEKLDEQEHKPSFDLVGFHSCSVSSIEVAYELKDTANYMLASQGPTFVGSWPYRQILIRIFKDAGTYAEIQDKEKIKLKIKELLKDIFFYCLHNSSDFLLAGYSHQVTLCDLRRIRDLSGPMEKLSTALVKALTKDENDEDDEVDAASKFVILFAHWRAQSFFQEMYTDLFDFCLIILDRCDRIRKAKGIMTPQLLEIEAACAEVKAKLAKPEPQNSTEIGQSSQKDPIICQAEFAGPAFQYSYGLSIYFPWTEPSEDRHILQQYKEYMFSQEFENSWLDFLKVYFKETQRSSRKDEQDVRGAVKTELTLAQELQEDIGSLIYSGEGPLTGALLKSDPNDRQGGDCDCRSLKNYARDTRARGERKKQAQRMPVSGTLLGRF